MIVLSKGRTIYQSIANSEALGCKAFAPDLCISKAFGRPSRMHRSISSIRVAAEVQARVLLRLGSQFRGTLSQEPNGGSRGQQHEQSAALQSDKGM
jgi:hypothetical protein